MRKIGQRSVHVGVLLALLSSAGAGAAATFTGLYSGASEVGPTGSPATGAVTVTYDATAHTLGVNVAFTGLVGGSASAAHIHCCVPPGSNAAVAIPLTAFPATTSGTYSFTALDLTQTASYSSGFLTTSGGTAAGAEAALAAGLANGTAYSNIHDATFPGGEIRANLVAQQSVAEVPALSGSGAVLLAVLLLVAGALWLRRL